MLDDFRRWLEALPNTVEDDHDSTSASGEEIDLATLLGQMIAIRQETNLLTRATRKQQELNQDSLERLGEALQLIQRQQSVAQRSQEASLEEQTRPLLRALLDAFEALALAADQVERTREELLPELESLAVEPGEPEPLPEQSPVSGSGWFGIGRGRIGPSPTEQRLREMIERERQERADEQARTRGSLERVRAMLASLVEGYRLGVQRLQRALGEWELEAMETVGETFDPERMEVVEVVNDGDYSPGEVVEEVSRGYLWRGRVFRYAKVRVAKLGE